MNYLTLKSPAKLNLYLKIIRRRPNGYHELVTLFQRISLCDTLRLQKKKQGFHLTTSQKGLSCGEDNLITRAYREIQNIYPQIGGISVRLTKRIPMGGGLGGGSGNAATFLLGIKKLYRLPLSNEKLIQIGSKLGADVAFFLHNTSLAIGKGLGDRIQPIPSRAKYWFLLVLDQEGLSTPQVYRALPQELPAVSLTRASRVATMLSDFLRRKNFAQASQLFANDLEAPAFKLRPSIQQTISNIQREGFLSVRMSGSGATVFAMLSSQAEAKTLAKRLKRQILPNQRMVICHSW